MTIFKRICLAALVLSLGVAGSAQAVSYSLAAGSGAQLHIGNGLALPVQAAATVVGGAFPPLLILPNGPQRVQGTTAMASGQRITVPANALKKAASQKTVGVFFSNPTLYAVATNLTYVWPTAPAVFSVNGRGGAATTVLFAGGDPNQKITYSPRVPGKRFGGAAAFALTPGPAAGLVAGSPITIYAIAIRPAGNPPCTHPAFTGAQEPPVGNAACVAALLNAMPTGVAAIGQAAGISITTPGGVGGLPPQPGVMVGKFGATPLGTKTLVAFTPSGNPGATNMATSFGFPFTTGMITIEAGQATGAPESFVISGKDTRTAGGAGTIQMVAGALSFRTLSKENANRGWVRLILEVAPVPALSPLPMGIAIVLMMLVPTVYFARRARSQAV
jgi:hypothetical protein